MPAFDPSFLLLPCCFTCCTTSSSTTALCALCQQLLWTPHNPQVLRSIGSLVQYADKAGCSGQSTDSTDSTDSTGPLRNRLVAANAALVSLTGNPDTHFGLVNEGAAPALVATLQYGKADCILSSHLAVCILAHLHGQTLASYHCSGWAIV